MHDVQRGTKNATNELADLSAWLRRRFGSLSSIRRFTIAATRRVGPYAFGLPYINSRLHIILIWVNMSGRSWLLDQSHSHANADSSKASRFEVTRPLNYVVRYCF